MAWEEHNSAPKGQRDADSSIVLATMDYIFGTLNSLLSPLFSMYQGVPYIAFQSDTERSNPCDLKAHGRPGVI